MVAVTLAIELLLMNAIGIFIRRMKITNQDFSTQLTSLLMKVLLPCLIFNSTRSALPFSLESLSNCAVIILLGAVALLLSLAIGHGFYVASKKSAPGRLTRYGLAFCHFSFMGIPVMDALFGATGTFYYAFFLIPTRLIFYSFSELLMTPPGQKGAKKSLGATLKNTMLTPLTIALVLGLIFWVGGWQLPTPIDYCIKTLSSLASPLALLLCGMIMAEHPFRQMFRLKYLTLPLLRTIAMPALFFALSRLFLLMGADDLLCRMFVIYGALPVASLMAVYAVKVDPDPNTHMMAAGASTISAMISAVTIPLWFLLIS